MKKSLSILCICILAILTCACSDSKPSTDVQSSELSEIDALIGFFENHTVFQTTLSVTFEDDSDIPVFKTILKLLGVEVSGIVISNETATYVLLSHFPFTDDTISAITEPCEAQILDADGNIILTAEDVLTTSLDYLRITCFVDDSFANKDAWGFHTLMLGETAMEVSITNDVINGHNVLTCSTINSDVAVAQKTAVAFSRSTFLGDVHINIIQPSERVNAKMES
ncbi:MAG: hypothetical protein E7651_05745 [Ruminococcaceae bacterium]|nr:hypothetical protein [Oscillospiraceae bacterium]